MKKILVFTGRKGRGKTTAANYTKELLSDPNDPYAYSVDHISFATPLKELCINFLGLRPDQCYGTNLAKKVTPSEWRWEEISKEMQQEFGKETGFITAREILQIVGTNLFRNHFADHIWVKAAINLVQKSDANVIVVDDARFPNEVESLRKKEAIMIRMLRNRPEDKNEHPSEKALDDYPNESYNYIIGPDVEGVPALKAEVLKILIKENLV